MKKKKGLIGILIALVIIIGLVLIFLLPGSKKEPEARYGYEINENDNWKTVKVIDPDSEEHKALWSANKAINDDYVGQIVFVSGLIDLPFVQAEDNDKYLRTDWQTMTYSLCGSVFMDYESSLDSQNIIIYGHYVGSNYLADGDKMFFTPLKQLKDESAYAANKDVYLILENEVRHYEIAKVFYCDLYKSDGIYYPNDALLYYLPEYDENYFDSYMAKINSVEFYDTGIELTYEDKLLTLQTCVAGREDLREIVIGRYVDSLYYD